MTYYLAKTDPETYSIDDLERERRTVWDGVKNPQALRAIAAMRPGDRVFIYHSMGKAAIVGLAKVRSAPRPDPKNPKLTVVDLEFLEAPGSAGNSAGNQGIGEVQRLVPGSPEPPFHHGRAGEVCGLDEEKISEDLSSRAGPALHFRIVYSPKNRIPFLDRRL